MIREMGENNVLRDDALSKLKEIKTEIFETQTIGRTNLGFYEWRYNGQYKLFHTIISQLKYGSSYSIFKLALPVTT